MTEWISVNDRLPEITDPDAHGKIAFSPEVLTFSVCDDGYVYMSIQRYTINKGGGWLMDIPGDGSRTTHWMPLPEPPTAGPVDGAPHVVTLDELINGVGIGYEENWLKGEDGEEDSFEVNRCAWCNGGVVLNDAEYVSRAVLERLYNKPYGLRVWSREPSEEQREKTPWARQGIDASGNEARQGMPGFPT